MEEDERTKGQKDAISKIFSRKWTRKAASIDVSMMISLLSKSSV